VGSVSILWLSLRKGIGGLTRLDVLCYALLGIDMVVWLTTRSAFLALHLTVLADVIAFLPTLIKTWRQPDSETATFFIVGAIAPLFSILAATTYDYGVLLFPLYLAVVNMVEVLLIYRPRLTRGPEEEGF